MVQNDMAPFRTPTKIDLFRIPIDPWVMHVQPVMSKDNFVPMYVSKHELDNFDISGNSQSYGDTVLEGAFCVWCAIHILEYYWLMHYLQVHVLCA